MLLASAREAGRSLRQHPRPARATALDIARTLRDQVGAAASHVGSETPDGWRLLDLRSRLDSHLLAVTTLDGAGVRDEVVLDLLGRAVIDLTATLTAILRR